MRKVTAASQAHFSSYDSAALIFAQESKALHTNLEERSKAEAASGDKLHAKMIKHAKTWSGLCLCCSIFSLESFQTFNLFFDRLVHWKTNSNRQKRHPLQRFTASEQAVLAAELLQCCIYHMYRCTSYIDVYRQKWSDVHICVYSIRLYYSLFTCDYSQL